MSFESTQTTATATPVYIRADQVAAIENASPACRIFLVGGGSILVKATVPEVLQKLKIGLKSVWGDPKL